MSKLDLSQFKKVHSTKTHTMFQHPDGHVIHLAHGGMTGDQCGDTSALPYAKMNKGGAIPPPKEGPKLDKDKTKEFEKGLKAALGFADGGDTLEEDSQDALQASQMQAPVSAPPQGSPFAVIGDMAPQPAPEMPATSLPGTPGMPQDATSNPGLMAGSGAEYNELSQGISGQIEGIGRQARAESSQGRAEGSIADKHAKELEVLNTSFAKGMQDLEKERQALVDSVSTNKINPSHYMENISTPGKVATVIGLILGGIGAGGTDGQNLAVTQLNAQIERDIKSQQANLDKQNNLLKFNLDRTKNMQDAQILTRAQLQEIYSTKLAKAAAESKDPMAQARAQEAIGKIRVANAKDIGAVVARMTLQRAMGKGKVSPENYIQMAVPKERQADAMKSLSALRGLDESIDLVNKEYGDTKNIGSLQTLNPLSNASTKLAAANAAIIGAVRQGLKGQGALSDQEIEDTVLPFKTGKFDRVSEIEIKNKGLVDKMNSARAQEESKLKSLNIPIPARKSGLPARDAAALKFAQENPSDPRSKEIMQHLNKR